MNARVLGLLSPPTSVATGVALLLLRLVVGYSLHLHGVPKMADPMHWLDSSPGLSHAVPNAPHFLEPVVAFAEAYGSLLIMAGLLTRIFALIVVCDLAVVVIFVGMVPGHPFVGKESYEIPALILSVMAALLIAGPGRYSLDALIARRS